MMKIRFLSALAALAIGAVSASAADDYLMESGDDHYVEVTDPFFFFDDGGATGVISNGFSGSVTFMPGVEDKAVKINTVEFAVGAGKMFVYSGAIADPEYILGSATGYFVSKGPVDLVSESEDGCLTVTFTGKGTTLKGWKIEVSLADKPVPQAEPMSGEYRVGPSADARFRNLAELQKAFEAGVSGPVTVKLEDNTYSENFLLKEIAGVSETNTITITSLSGNASACVIGGSADVLDYQGTVCVDATPFVTFRNITVSAPAGNGSRTPYAALHLRNGSRDCVVENCVVKAPLTSENDNRTYVLLANAGAADGSGCDGLTVRNNRISGGYVGLYVGSDPDGDNNVVTGRVTVSGNDFADVNYRGMQIGDCNGFVLDANSIDPGVSGKKGAVYIDVMRPSGAFRVTSNRVLTSQSTDCTGIYLRNGGGGVSAAEPALVANNVVALTKASSAYTYGMMIDASMKYLTVAHNTINVSCTSRNLKNVFGIAFSGKAAEKGISPVIASNIVRTALSGTPLRPWDATHYANMTFSGNVWFGADGVMDGDSKSFDDYCAATADNTSIWHEASFLSDSDLHLREAVREMFKPRMEAVGADRDNRVRTEPTAAGAYEFDIPAAEVPLIAQGYPRQGELTAKTVELTTMWSVGGTLYAKAVPAADAAPSAEVLMQQRGVAVEAVREAVSTFSGLQPVTAYKAYFMVVSPLGAQSAVVASDEFTTLDEIQPLTAFIFWQDEPFSAGETVELTAAPEGGVLPYTFEWTDQAGESLGNAETVTFTAETSGTYRLRVTSADGQATVCKVNVPVVTEELAVATFEDLYLAAESNWMYDTELSTDDGTLTDVFFSGSFAFGNTSMPLYSYWSGYGYSNETSTSYATLADQMHNVVGGGAAETAAYGVAYLYGPGSRIGLSVAETGVTVPGMYVTNSAYTRSSVIDGDAYSPKFEAGDYHDLVIEGFLADESTGKVIVSLADYRGESPAVLSEWLWVDLSPLGNVDALNLSFDGTKTETVPAYVCIDQIGAKSPKDPENPDDPDDPENPDDPDDAIVSVEADSAAGDAVFFDLQGRRVANPSAGIYIMVRGGEASRVMIR